jgi:hypothetical protein
MVRTENEIKLFLKNIIKCLDDLSHNKFIEIYKTFSKRVNYYKTRVT